jgi:hypothetical protein
VEEQIVEQPVTIVKAKRGPKVGHAKWGGRKKGTQNKRTRFAHDVAENMGVDPVRFLLEIVHSDALQIVVTDPITGKVMLNPDGTPRRMWIAVTTQERLDASKTLIGYMYPKLQAMQITGQDGGPVEVASLDMTQILMDPELAKAAQQMALMLADQMVDTDAARSRVIRDVQPVRTPKSGYE